MSTHLGSLVAPSGLVAAMQRRMNGVAIPQSGSVANLLFGRVRGCFARMLAYLLMRLLGNRRNVNRCYVTVAANIIARLLFDMAIPSVNEMVGGNSISTSYQAIFLTSASGSAYEIMRLVIRDIAGPILVHVDMRRALENLGLSSLEHVRRMLRLCIRFGSTLAAECASTTPEISALIRQMIAFMRCILAVVCGFIQSRSNRECIDLTREIIDLTNDSDDEDEDDDEDEEGFLWYDELAKYIHRRFTRAGVNTDYNCRNLLNSPRNDINLATRLINVHNRSQRLNQGRRLTTQRSTYQVPRRTFFRMMERRRHRR